MQITVLKVLEYQGAKIYFRQFERCFEFIMAYDGEVWAKHIEIKDKAFSEMSKEEIDNAVTMLNKIATSIIDTLQAPPKSEADGK